MPKGNCAGKDLSGADLSGLNLVGASFANANLSGATLDGALLSKADLSGADITGASVAKASFDGANLADANLAGVDATGIDFSGAQLTNADFTGATLIDAVLTGATVARATFESADLSTFQASDPMFASAVMCKSRMSGGVIDSRSCPCRPGGGGASVIEPALGQMAPGPYTFVPKGWIAAAGQEMAINRNSALFALFGTTYGGNGRTTFAAPKPTGPWAGLRTGEKGDGACLPWSVATYGQWPMAGGIPALPGEVYFTSIAGYGQGNIAESGAKKLDLGYLLGEGFTAWQIPARWDPDASYDAMMGSLHLFPTSTSLPEWLTPAQGQALLTGNGQVNQSIPNADVLYSLLGDTLPNLLAPDGYAWAVANRGIYPDRG